MGSTEEEQARFLEEAKAANDTWAIDRIPTEAPQHRVKITKPFYLGKYEVTQAQWQAVMGEQSVEVQGRPTNPVEQVSWDDIQPFLAKLNVAGTLRVPSATTPRWCVRNSVQRCPHRGPMGIRLPRGHDDGILFRRQRGRAGRIRRGSSPMRAARRIRSAN